MRAGRQAAKEAGTELRRRVPVASDPAAWLTGVVLLLVAASSAWGLVGRGQPPAFLSPGGVATLLGALVVGGLAVQMRRRRIFADLDRGAGWTIIAVCALYWLSGLTTPGGGEDTTPPAVAAGLFIAGLALYPVLWWGLPSLSWVRPSREERWVFGLDNAIVVWAGAIVLWHLVLYPVARTAGASLPETVMVAISPAADLSLVLLALGMARVPMRGISRTAARLLILAFTWVFVTDVLVGLVALNPQLKLAPLADLSRGWFWVTIALVLHVLTRRGSVSEARTAGTLSISWLPYGAIGVAFVVPIFVSWSDLELLRQLLPAAGVLVALALARLAVMARQNARLVASGAARRTEARFHALVQNTADLVLLTDVDTRVRYLTPSATRVFGLDVSMPDATLASLLHPDDLTIGLAVLAEVAATTGSSRRVEWRLRRGDGTFVEAEMVLSNLLHVPEVAGLVLTARDIGERKSLERELAHQVLHDPLTGLANRTLFTDRLRHALLKSERRRGHVAVVFLDLDDFKRINDGWGHGVGDRLLVGAAQRIGGVLRAGDTAARLGGDEFAVLLEDLDDVAEAREVADRIREVLDAPFDLRGTETFVRGSIGVAVGRGTEVGPEELLRDADVAMYVAKAKGKGRTETFDPRMHQDVQDRLALEADLRRAITRDEFVVHYQPVWATSDRQVIGVEALVRWHHPTSGMLGPVEFIALAEETGLIVAIGSMVLREACRQVAEWDRHGGIGAGLTLAVNLSPRQLREVDLVETVASALADAGLPARRLNLEITEAVLVDDSPATAELLARLKALGVRISIDDFGTGYSSLSYLRRLPIDTLKIAKPFVDVIVNGAKDRALAQAIVSFARSLQLQVVAEGIEEEAQLDALVAIGCELGQGFLVSPPVAAELLPVLTRTVARDAA